MKEQLLNNSDCFLWANSKPLLLTSHAVVLPDILSLKYRDHNDILGL